MVTVSFDPALIPEPEAESDEPKETSPDGELPDDVIAPDPNDPKTIADEKEAKEKADRAKADYEKKIADGKKRVQELTDRFASWYYVTPGASFRSINLDRAALIRPKQAVPPPGGHGAGGFPGFPGGGGELPTFPEGAGGLPQVHP